MTRRSFLAFGVGMVAAPVAAQKTYMKKEQAVSCDSEVIKCPLGHESCKTVNMPLAIGNDSYSYEEVHQLRDYHVIRCDQCHILFTRE